MKRRALMTLFGGVARSGRAAMTARTIALAIAALLIELLGAAAADDIAKYPDKPVRVVVGFSAGSSVDLAARTIGEKLSEVWKQPVVTENRPGAGGVIAAQTVGRAAPDGYTLLSVSASHVILPALSSTLPYHPRDFVGITTTVSVPAVLVVSPSLGIKSVKDLVALAKGKPGELLFSSGGVGSGTHFAAELFKSHTAIDVRHVPYRGIPEALTEVIAGRIQFTFSPLASVLPLTSTGEVIALAVAPASRVAALPSVPTLAEAGITGYRWDSWFGLLAPAQTPPAIVTKLNQDVTRILDLPDVKKRWEVMGAEAMPMTPEQFDRYLSEQLQLVTQLVKAANIQIK